MAESDAEKMMRVRLLDIIPLAKSSKKEAFDNKNGIARVGGRWRTPCYFSAYIRAAEVLIKGAKDNNQLDELGLPIFYLQRHALELCIKEVLTDLYEEFDCRVEESDRRDKAKVKPISTGQKDRLKREHKLGLLCKDLEKICTNLKCEFDTKSLEALVSQIETCEVSRPAMARYSKSSAGEKHLPEEVSIPIAAIQEDLEKVANKMRLLQGDMRIYTCLQRRAQEELSDSERISLGLS